MQTINTDIIIIGAGIAGLWIHHRLNDLGLHSILIDKRPIGGVQTLSSQGIIHGGAKYTLGGLLSNAASAIADMPERWLACLEGHGEINLAETKLLSANQLMWSTQGLSSKLTSFFSSKALNSKIKPMKSSEYPKVFQNSLFKGHLYQLNEPVLDVPSLLQNLSKKWQHRILYIPENYSFKKNGQDISKIVIGNHLELCAQEFIFTAGEGNEQLRQDVSLESPKMQRRPLQMVLAKGAELPWLYAHCIGASTKPIATITSHQHSDGETVWYIGGNIAEEGVAVSAEQLISNTQNTLTSILPWIPVDNLQWATHIVNRAEPAQKNLLRPDTAFIESIDNIHIAWPTKLALTPNLSDQLIDKIKTKSLSTTKNLTKIDEELSHLPENYSCQLADNLWERIFNATK